MADAEKKSKISQFASVAGVSEDRARFFLESAAWNLESAMATFFENGGSMDEDDGSNDRNQQEIVDLTTDTPPVSSHQPQPSGSRNPPTGSGSSQPSAPFSRAREPARFGTLNTLRDDEDSSEEEGQAFYAGGSEHSGQQILGPKKKNRDSNTIVSNMFKAAREHGAEVVEPAAETSASGGRSATFQGRAYRLGDSETTSQVIGSSAGPPADSPAADLRPRELSMVLKMWKNGFSIDDGPLRDFSAPENMQFLEDIRNGDVPRELIQLARGGQVNLNLEDHRTEEYVKPATVLRPFAGEGHRLGCPSDPVTAANETAHTMAGGAFSSSASAPAATTAAVTIAVNPSLPTTSLQIRLADGSRLVSKFNHSHRISDVRQYIIDSRPQYTTANFVLMTTFPNAELTDETLTLVDAKLLNAVIVQRMK